MKRIRKKYKKPIRPWDKERIEKEKEILKNFGLRRKREIWRAEALLRKFRRMARELAAKKDKEKERELIERLVKLGLLSKNASLDDILDLTVENILDRRLQTLVFKKGFANTPKQARQLIVHGHINIGGKKVFYPSYFVKKNEEDKIQVTIAPKVKKEVVSNG
jgi:small subunit ribosomal protein S4